MTQPIVFDENQLTEAAEILLEDSYLDGATPEDVAEALSTALYEFVAEALANPSHFVSRHGSAFHRTLRNRPLQNEDNEIDFSQAA